jgi:hypothetical protein
MLMLSLWLTKPPQEPSGHQTANIMGLDMYIMRKVNGGKSEQVGYFRKFNALHGWISKNVGEVENLAPVVLSEEKLRDLCDVMENVMDCPELAASTFPPREGFFFGSQDIDPWYFHRVGTALELFWKLRMEASEALQERGEVHELEYVAWW